MFRYSSVANLRSCSTEDSRRKTVLVAILLYIELVAQHEDRTINSVIMSGTEFNALRNIVLLGNGSHIALRQLRELSRRNIQG